MSAYPQFLAATPRVTRMEMADLYAGDATTVVQLDAIPCDHRSANCVQRLPNTGNAVT
jgi:hypothetical protein